MKKGIELTVKMDVKINFKYLYNWRLAYNTIKVKEHDLDDYFIVMENGRMVAEVLKTIPVIKKPYAVICELLVNGEAFYGTAACNPKDRFDKAKGKLIALSRAQKAWDGQAVKVNYPTDVAVEIGEALLDMRRERQ